MSQIRFDWWFQIKAALCERETKIVVSHIQEIWGVSRKNKYIYNNYNRKKKADISCCLAAAWRFKMFRGETMIHVKHC